MISLTADLTDRKGRHAHGWLFFDADCNHCRKIARVLQPILHRRGMALAPLQDPRVGALLGMTREELLREIRVVLSDGRQYGGADAVVALATKIWWASPIVWFSRLPRGIEMLRRWYHSMALHRHCVAATCPVAPATRH